MLFVSCQFKKHLSWTCWYGTKFTSYNWTNIAFGLIYIPTLDTHVEYTFRIIPTFRQHEILKWADHFREYQFEDHNNCYVGRIRKWTLTCVLALVFLQYEYQNWKRSISLAFVRNQYYKYTYSLIWHNVLPFMPI